MSNNEPAFEDTASFLDSKLDNILGVPLLVFSVGLFGRETSTIQMALGAWVLAAVIWTPWIIIRVRMGRPTGDTARAAGVLGIGLLPLAPLPFCLELLSTFAGAAVAFAIVFLWGAGAMLMAGLQWPRPKPGRGRTATLVLGGLSYGLVAALFFLFVGLTSSEPDSPGGGFVLMVAVLLGGLSAVAGLSVLAAAASRPKGQARAPGG